MRQLTSHRLDLCKHSKLYRYIAIITIAIIKQERRPQSLCKVPSDLGAVHMSRASPANRADLSHKNLYFSAT